MKDMLMTKLGTLSVELKSNSGYLGSNLPIEVRDSHMRLIQGDRSARQFDLPAGLYEVSAILDDGRRHIQVVQIKAGENTPVEFGFGQQLTEPESTLQVEPTESLYERSRYTLKMDSLTDTPREFVKGLSTQLLDLDGASLVSESPGLWVFECVSDLDRVPTALIQVENHRKRISLPISQEGGFPLNSCAVRVVQTRSGSHVDAWISTERTTANALQNTLASGYVLQAADVAREAVNLLLYKYSDPAGAALGALILYKVGRMETRIDWLENLAGDFDWLPDGKVMLANLLVRDEHHRDRAFELAIKASSQRMLYTENYSLLLDLLRRWPSDHYQAARQEAVNKMAVMTSDLDWESICLCQTVEDE
jgi:hypothetical protein